jgi:Domain of unknown function (DUF4333)
MRRSTALAAAVVAAGLVTTACGSTEPPTILDTEKVERAIEASSMAQRGQRAQLSCPSGVRQEEGSVFSCTAVVGTAKTRFVVTQIDDAGRVRYEAP